MKSENNLQGDSSFKCLQNMLFLVSSLAQIAQHQMTVLSRFGVHICRRATWGGTFGTFATPEIFKTLHSNFDICRNFQRIKMKFYILIILKKSY